MTSQQLDQEAIFHVARDIHIPSSRAQYLAQVCAGDQNLRERVEALLEVHENEQAFLKSDPDAAPTVDHTPLTEHPGTTIGRYKLMEQIGEGGMGVVFVAEQERPIRRKVALKVVKPGMDSKAVVARFEAERQALALMDHPNIAKVLDAGTTDSGRPYFVMELVRGIPITDYCDEHKLTIRERLELFTQVCQAIQHAHQKAIIHRDIKPTNVLVTEQDGKAVPKVIDFGVAKALNQRLTERTIYTSFAQVVGTPLYMSPEQAALSAVDVDTRSDVYSLGVLLYELLTGTTPFDKQRFEQAAYDEIRRIVREEEPPKPSTKISTMGDNGPTIADNRHTDHDKLHRSVRGDLDWIVMKALEKDRVRRYETASGFASDLEAFLGNKAVEARPPSTWYQLEKLFERNKPLVATTLTVFLALLGGLCVALWGLKEASESAEQARVDRDRFAALLGDYEPLVLNEILNNVFSGDLEVAKKAIEDAETVGVSEKELVGLRGSQKVFSGEQESYRDGIRIFEQMLASNEDDVIALSMLLWAHGAGYGDLDELFSMRERHRALEPEGAFESVVWAAAASVESIYLVSSEGARAGRAKETLEGIVEQNPSWKLARLLLARVLSDHAVDTGESKYVVDAIEYHLPHAQLHKRLISQPPFWLSQQLHVYNVGSRLAPEHQRDRYRQEAERLAAALLESGHDDYLLGRLERALFLTSTAEVAGGIDFRTVLEEWETFQRKSQSDLYGPTYVGLLLRSRLVTDELWDEDNLESLGMAYARGDRDVTLTLCENALSSSDLLDQFWTNAAKYACGSNARAEALDYFRELKKLDSLPTWIQLPLDLFLGEKQPQDVIPTESRVHQAWAYYVTGCYLFMDGRSEEAKEYFDKSISCQAFLWDSYHWAHALRMLIDKDPDWHERMNPSAARNRG